MATYRYKVVNEKGEKLEGIYEASSRDEVMQMISTNNYYPIKIEEQKSKNNLFTIRVEKKIGMKDLAIFCRQFYTMFNAGLSINNCLKVLEHQINHKVLKKALADIEDRVKKGQTMAEAMGSLDDIFPQLLINMIASGEESGNLDIVMLRMANYYEKESKNESKIKNAMIYPIVLSVVALLIMIILITFVVPTFVSLFDSSEMELPSLTKFILGTSRFIGSYWYLILLLIIAAVWSISTYLGTPKGKVNMDNLKLKLPIVKGLNQKIIVSRFTSTLSTLLASGISIIQSLEIVSAIVGNKVAESDILNIRERMLRGESLGTLIQQSSIFPMMLASMVSIGEESGKLEEILSKTTDFYNNELENEIQKAITLIEPLLIVVMGVIIGIMVLAIVIPMVTMYNIV